MHKQNSLLANYVDPELLIRIQIRACTVFVSLLTFLILNDTDVRDVLDFFLDV
jgi:hypothetical protein